MTPIPSRGGQKAPSGGAEPLTTLGLAGAAAFALLAGVVWAAGQLAALVWAGRWPAVVISEAPAVLVRLPDHLADPAAAWPPDAAAALPGPVLLYTTLAVVVAAAAGLAWAALSLWRRLGSGGDDETAAAWATRRQLRPLLVNQPTPGRLTLGRHGRKLVAAEPRQSVAVIGPTQSGKTTGLAIPAIREWAGPVIATSVKTDLLRDTLTEREHHGEAWVYDPTQSTGLPAAGWSPLASCGDWQAARRTADWLAAAAKQSAGGLAEADFWHNTAAKLLAPLLFAAASGGYTIADVVRWVDTQNETEPRAALEHAGVAEALEAAAASWGREAKHRSSVYTTAETILAAYADPTVARSARSHDVEPERLLDGGHHTLYLCAPTDEQTRLRPLFTTLLQTVLSAAYRRAHTTGAPLNPPLLVVLDEAANIAPLPELDTLAATAAGQGIQLVTVWQDLSQIKTRYHDRAHTILNNHRATLLLPGVKDPDTLDHTSQLLGETETTRQSTTTDAAGRRSTTEGVEHRRLMPDHEVRAMPQGQAVLIYGALAPTRVRLRSGECLLKGTSL
jgi:type IV secretion system protein VirD4